MLSEFEKKVLEKLRFVPTGKVTTYALLAKAVGNPRAARAVGNALNKNPDAPIVPCHRVVKSDGGLGGYASGNKKKIELLESEGIVIKNNRIIDFSKKLFVFKK